MAVYSYTRVSTTAQSEEGESLGASSARRGLRYAARSRGRRLSSKTAFPARCRSTSGPRASPARARRRATRSSRRSSTACSAPPDALGILDELKEQGVSLHMIDLGGDVTGNGISKLVFTILIAVAEAERDRIRERIPDVKRDQKTRGRFLGGSRRSAGRSPPTDRLSCSKASARRCWQCAGCRRRARACAPSRPRCRSAGLQSRTKASSRCWRALTRPCDLAGDGKAGGGQSRCPGDRLALVAACPFSL